MFVLQKLLKAKWNYTTQEQIEKHDARVRRNWESLLKDELEVPNEDLKKHLLSFSQRSKILSSSRKGLKNIPSFCNQLHGYDEINEIISNPIQIFPPKLSLLLQVLIA